MCVCVCVTLQTAGCFLSDWLGCVQNRKPSSGRTLSHRNSSQLRTDWLKHTQEAASLQHRNCRLDHRNTGNQPQHVFLCLRLVSAFKVFALGLSWALCLGALFTTQAATQAVTKGQKLNFLKWPLEAAGSKTHFWSLYRLFIFMITVQEWVLI